jgi:hypothetical protein
MALLEKKARFNAQPPFFIKFFADGETLGLLGFRFSE